ncbi:MAG: Crp/Fnr family transcriptional regulator [Muribaculaceae bacterium]|nr:Crp/Fnr family transcriptional regulator [Muribaculaceae bacterium]MDE7393501.1 Crp/Fnr family transcriptional regulator [Muribaculaceae bacterium]
MPSQFNSYIDRINTEMWRNLCVTNGQLRHYNRGDEFITAGKVGQYIGFIESGSLKYECYSEDGTPHVIGLEFEGQFVCDFPFSLYGCKSRASIIATTPCDIYCLSSKWLAEQQLVDPEIKELIYLTTREVFATLYDRYVDLYTKTAKQRYDELLVQDRNLFALYSLQDIASLLNITPTHLSRLRKQV